MCHAALLLPWVTPSPTHNISCLKYGFSLCHQINNISAAGDTSIPSRHFCVVSFSETDRNQPWGEKYNHHIANPHRIKQNHSNQGSCCEQRTAPHPPSFFVYKLTRRKKTTQKLHLDSAAVFFFNHFLKCSPTRRHAPKQIFWHAEGHKKACSGAENSSRLQHTHRHIQQHTPLLGVKFSQSSWWHVKSRETTCRMNTGGWGRED